MNINININDIINYIKEMINATINGSIVMLILAFGIVFFLIILSLILIISYVKALKKAGKSGSNVLWMFIPIPLIPNIILALKLEPVKKFGKGSGYLLGLILIPIIFVPLLAFSDKKEDFDNNVGLNKESEENVKNINSELNADINTNLMNNEVIEKEAEINDDVEVGLSNNETDLNAISNNNLNVEEPVSDFEISVKEPVEEVPIIENTYEFQEPKVLEPEISIIPEESEEETLNAFNITPVIEESIVELEPIDNNFEEVNDITLKENKTIEDNIILENNSAKVCKNCGTEMPNIVSICPNCGTDNE